MSRTVGWLPTTPILTSLFFAIVLTLGFGFGSRIWFGFSALDSSLGFGIDSWIRVELLDSVS